MDCQKRGDGTHMSERLKNCPFCGKYPQTVVDDETEKKFGVKCFNCGGMIYPEKATLQEAIEAWNRRVPETDEYEVYG